jgi:predicted nucleotidyltransferase
MQVPVGCPKVANYIVPMDRDTIIARLRAHEREFRQLGVTSLSLFGSSARRENIENSDVDVAVKLNRAVMPKGFRYAGRLEFLRKRLEETLECPVDLVSEPVLKAHFQEAIDRDRVVAF